LTRPLVIITALGLIALAFFGLLADAEPETVFYAQTATGLFLVIVVVVLVATLVTAFYMRVFGKLADKISSQRFSRFVGWKFLRSQRVSETLLSRSERSFHTVRTRPFTRKLIITGVGLLLLLATLWMSRPAAWNAVADGVSPSFATALMLVLTVLGSALTLVGVAGLVLPTKKPEPNPQLRQRNAVTLPTFISIIGVAIGLWALIVVLGVIHGLQSDLREKILRTNAHMVIEPQRPDGILGDSVALEAAMRALPRVTEADAYVRGEVMMSSPTAIAVNVVIKGMLPEALAASEQIRGRIIDGSLLGLSRPEALISERPRYPSESTRRRRPQIPIPDDDEDDRETAGSDPDDNTTASKDAEKAKAASKEAASPSAAASNDSATAGTGLKSLAAAGQPIDITNPVGALVVEADNILPSSWGLSQDLYPGILLGAELARQLGLEVGDEVQLISPDGDVGPTGLRPKLASFRVAGIFRTGMYEYDQKLAYTALYAAQRFFDLGRDRNQLEARIDDADAIDDLAAAVPGVLEKFPGLVSSSLRERNKNLFSALALERIVMFVILGFIVFVASLLIVSSLVMLVVEKVREIAVLKALGASDSAIVRSFVTIGTFIGLFGVLAGIPLGVGSCVYLIAAGFSLPREFYLSELPVKLDAFEITVFGLTALGLCLIATIYPSRKAAQLKPADGLRHG